MNVQSININNNLNNRKSQKQSFKMKVDRDLFTKVVEEEVNLKKPFEKIFSRLKNELKKLYEINHRPHSSEKYFESGRNNISFPTENRGKVTILLDDKNNLFYKDISGNSKKKRGILYTNGYGYSKIKQEVFPAGTKEIVNTTTYNFDESSKSFVEVPNSNISFIR